MGQDEGDQPGERGRARGGIREGGAQRVGELGCGIWGAGHVAIYIN